MKIIIFWSLTTRDEHKDDYHRSHINNVGGDGFISMQVNARTSTSSVSMNFFEEADIDIMVPSASLSDLNTIEHC